MQSNTVQLFNIENEIHGCEQGIDYVTTFFTKLKALWDERDALCDLNPYACEEGGKLSEYVKNQKTMKFLMGLNENYVQMHDTIVAIEPLPAVNKAYSMVLRHEKQATSPVWERELLSARDPPRISCTHKEFDDSIDHSYLKYGATVQQSYCFGPNKEIKALRELLPPHLSTCSSTFELITACVWKCRTISLDMDPEQIVSLSCIITALGKHNNVCLPLGYYGNTFTYPAVVSRAERLCNSPLGYAVELVKKSKAKMSEEYFRSAIDFVEVRGRPPLAMEGMSDFIVSDNTRTGLGEIDFGLGKPVYAGVAESIDLISFYGRSTNKEERYEILVPLCLPLLSMEMFQQELKKMIGSDKVETPSHIKL